MKIARKALAAIAASLTIALLLWQGMALAVGGVGGLGVGTGSGSSSGNEAYSPQIAEPPDDPTDDGDNEGHETDNPEKPDHAGGGIVEVQLAGGEVISVGQNDASIEDDGQAHSDVVVLSLLGSEIIGAHSNCPAVGCEGGTASEGVAPGVLCEETGGGVCVGILFAEANSSVENDESSSSADQVLAFTCVGGTQTAPAENCDGIVGAGVSEQHSTITQDNTTGATEAESSTDVADVCVGPTGEDPITGTCSGLGVSALHSESSSSAPSETAPGTTERSSYVAVLELGGAPVLEISDQMELVSVPPGCPAGASLLCVFINQGEGFVYPGGAGSAQEALHVSVLAGVVDGEDVVGTHSGSAETLVENTGPACPPGSTADHCVEVCPDTGLPPMPDGTCPPEERPPGLANTGLSLVLPLALALALMVMGAHLVALDRRRGAATV